MLIVRYIAQKKKKIHYLHEIYEKKWRADFIKGEVPFLFFSRFD